MEDRSVQFLVAVMAVATPLLATYIHFQARLGHMAYPRRGRLLMLFLAGPVNWLCWMMLRGPMGNIPGRQLIGALIALAVFATMGFGFGLLRRDDRAAEETRRKDA